MSTGSIEPYDLDGTWLIVRSMHWPDADRHSFEAWTGQGWTEEINLATEFQTQAQAEAYMDEHREQLFGAKME